jgi:hypothetical protein
MSDTNTAASADVLLKMADRCEREEASFELEADIARTIGWTLVRMTEINERVPGFKGPQGCPPGENYLGWVPGFSRSLDAAVTLVPPEFHWSVDGRNPQETLGTANVYQIATSVPAARCFGAKTPALALCAAALRARAAMVKK